MCDSPVLRTSDTVLQYRVPAANEAAADVSEQRDTPASLDADIAGSL